MLGVIWKKQREGRRTPHSCAIQLEQKTGENDKALEEIQKQLYRAISQALQMLMMLMQTKEDAREALEIAKIYRRVEAIFAVGGGMSAGLLMQQYMVMGRKKEALACLTQMVVRWWGSR